MQVVAGALVAPGRGVLIAERPAGKTLAGRWEFPGGKVNAGEGARQALERELAEELGIQVDRAEPLLAVTHRYAGAAAAVRIDCWRVRSWRGEPTGLDGQRLRWCPLAALGDADILEADRPIVTALRLPSQFVHVAAAARAARPPAPVAWLVGSHVEAVGVALDGDVVCIVDPTTATAHCSVYSTAGRFVRSADRRALAGRVVADAGQAAAAAAAGADFLLVTDSGQTVSELAGVAAAGLPWYWQSAGPAAADAATLSTGTLCWPALAVAGRR